MDSEKEIDLSIMPYDEWLLFVFDHPVSNRWESDKEWYWQYQYEISEPSQLVEHFTLLCNQFVSITKKYSLPQIDQGIWFILGACIFFGQYLRKPEVPIEARKTCVESMYRVFADFVSKSDIEEMENCFWMWWDILLDGFYIFREPEFDEDAREIEIAILDTLTRILQLDDIRTQKYALHGLGHLKCAKAREVVAQYIDANRDKWTEEGNKWLQQCRDGKVM